MDARLVIIGAGVAGLTAGCYAARAGYATTILEAANLPGGLCTSWRRKGYLFDGSAAGLAGSAPGTPIFSLWKDIGVHEGCELYNPTSFGEVVCTDGSQVTVHTDIDALERHFLEVLPGDEEHVRYFARALRALTLVDIPYATHTGFLGTLRKTLQLLKTLPVLPWLSRASSISLADFCARLANPRSREVFTNLVHFGGTDVPLLTVLLPLAYAHRKMTGIPRNGWLAFSRSLEKQFTRLGGELSTGVRVTGLLRREGRVAGVHTHTGEVIPAARVMSAADGWFTMVHLLGRPADEADETFPPSRLSDQPVQVSLGVAEDWSGFEGPVTFVLDVPVIAAGHPQTRITVHHSCRNPAAAPAGKSALICYLESDWEFWNGLGHGSPLYQSQKEAAARAVIDAVDRHRPGFAAHVEVIDVATPLTRERWTGNRRGAMQARKPDASAATGLLGKGPSYADPDLDGFYMAGQWVEPWGGITTAAQSGRNAVIELCRRDGVPFR